MLQYPSGTVPEPVKLSKLQSVVAALAKVVIATSVTTKSRKDVFIGSPFTRVEVFFKK
jgi:hypothetical protein